MEATITFLSPRLTDTGVDWHPVRILFGQGRDGRSTPPCHQSAVLVRDAWAACQGRYCITLDDERIAEGVYVPVTVENDSAGAASAAGLLPSPSFAPGQMTLWAQHLPEGDIRITYCILS